MLISIFEGINPFPKSAKEKQKQSFAVNGWTDSDTGEVHEPIIPVVIEVNSEDDIIEYVTKYAWSPFTFSGKKIQENFVSTDFAVLDVDNGLTIQEAEKRVEEANIACLCVPTTSHTPNHHKFRLIFPLSRTIFDKATYIATMEDLFSNFEESDRSCVTDNARYYFGSTLVDGFWYEGELLIPTRSQVKKERIQSKKIKIDDDISEFVSNLYAQDRGFIPEPVDFFIKNAHTGIQGEWTTSLNKFVFILALQGLSYDDIYYCVQELAPDGLDSRDIRTIKLAFRDGEKARDNE